MLVKIKRCLIKVRGRKESRQVLTALINWAIHVLQWYLQKEAIK